jgi:hypothetical protein
MVLPTRTVREDGMRRREFIAGLDAATAWPAVASAQQPKGVPRIGFLATGSLELPEALVMINAFRQGLRELGYVEGENILTGAGTGSDGSPRRGGRCERGGPDPTYSIQDWFSSRAWQECSSQVRQRDWVREENHMKHSVNRILTSHAGSLPRPQSLIEVNQAKPEGRAVNEPGSATPRAGLHQTEIVTFGSAPRSGRGGRRFKSCHSDQHLAKSSFSLPTVSPAETIGCCNSFQALCDLPLIPREVLRTVATWMTAGGMVSTRKGPKNLVGATSTDGPLPGKWPRRCRGMSSETRERKQRFSLSMLSLAPRARRLRATCSAARELKSKPYAIKVALSAFSL